MCRIINVSEKAELYTIKCFGHLEIQQETNASVTRCQHVARLAVPCLRIVRANI